MGIKKSLIRQRWATVPSCVWELGATDIKIPWPHVFRRWIIRSQRAADKKNAKTIAGRTARW